MTEVTPGAKAQDILGNTLQIVARKGSAMVGAVFKVIPGAVAQTIGDFMPPQILEKGMDLISSLGGDVAPHAVAREGSQMIKPLVSIGAVGAATELTSMHSETQHTVAAKAAAPARRM